MHSLPTLHKRHKSPEVLGGLAAFLWGWRPGRARGGDLAGEAGVQGPGRAGLTKRPPGLPKLPRRLVLFLLLALLFTLPTQAHEDHFADSDTRILVFSKTAGFRHDSIPAGIEALRGLGAENGFAVDATEDADRFTDEGLAPYAAVVFLNTTGDILNPAQEAAFERYIAAGNGYVGVHSAADTEYGWPWYGELVGAYFDSHPEIQDAQIRVSDPAHPSTAFLPRRWARRDEWYNYRTNPRGRVHVLATLDESSYNGGGDGHDHPIAWCHDYAGGRAWYTGGGHTRASYGEANFRRHILGGLEYAAGLAPEADCGAGLDANFERAILDDDLASPMDLAVAPGGDVYYIERGGEIRRYNAGQRQSESLARLAVSTQQEDGLLGIALDPGFAANGWLYLFYSPAGSRPVQHVSRFTVDDGRLQTASEQVILEIPTQREQCCHSGGALVFGADGDLYIGVGDNTNPFDSDGYSPVDERPGRQAFDAQRTSANTQDLRGKILRIRPRPDGGYDIPPGNLFADPADGRPEIYIMGVRNPFRFSVDPQAGWLYWGDVGPDAGSRDPRRGPAGLDEWNRAATAGNYGWPYCVGDNQAYRPYDFANGISGPSYTCAAPTNHSPNNTGATDLPPARPAWIWYPYGESSRFPAVTNGSGRTAMAGPTYRRDPATAGEQGLPAYYDGALFIYEWARNWIKTVRFDDDGELLEIVPFLDGHDFIRPIDLEIGPEGAVYVLEWGSGFGGNNDDARLSRLDYVSGTRSPIARIRASATSGHPPLTVDFSAAESTDPDPGSVLRYSWNFGDGDVEGPQARFTYRNKGAFTARLTVTDAEGNSGSAAVEIVVGNTPPTIELLQPPDGAFFSPGESIEYAIRVDDAEDGGGACEAAVLQSLIGHDEHSHPLEEYIGCEGRFSAISGHGADGDNIFQVVEARYTDRGGEAPALIGRTGVVLHPKRKQAQYFSRNQGVRTEQTGDFAGGALNLGFIEDGDYVSYAPINLSGIDSLRYRVASAGPGGRIEARVGSPTGRLISRAEVTPTGAWQTYTYAAAAVEDPGFTHELFLVFRRNPGDSGLFNINWIDFVGPGISRPLASAVLDEESGAPRLFGLEPAYPNPFNPTTTIAFSLPADGQIRLEIFDSLGRKTQTLLQGPYAAGRHTAIFAAPDLGSGVYFYRLSTPWGTQSRRLLLLK